MKKLLSAVMILLVLCTFCLGGCSSDKGVVINEDSIIITVSSDVCDITSSTTLVDYMEVLQENGEFTFEIYSGMVTKINDIEPSFANNEFWGLYTDDADMSNSAWGEFTYDDITYGSAVVGASALVIVEGYTYIWTVSSF